MKSAPEAERESWYLTIKSGNFGRIGDSIVKKCAGTHVMQSVCCVAGKNHLLRTFFCLFRHLPALLAALNAKLQSVFNIV